MKKIRDGMEDYELLAMAKQLGLGDQAKQIAKGVYPTTYQSTSSPAAIDSARSQLAQLILHATGKDATPAQPTTGEAGSTVSAAGVVPPIGSVGDAFPTGGCSSSGPQGMWFALPLFGLLLLRLRRRNEG